MIDRPQWNSSSTKGRPSVPEGMSMEASLFPVRMSTKLPASANGADLAFCCFADERFFYCKDDKDGRLIRATEWLFTKLARHLGIKVPDCAILEDPISAETFFGSLQIESSASEYEARHFFSTPKHGDFGQPSEWPGAFLSGMYAYDLFIGNHDRSLKNFLVFNEGMSRAVCAYDFASAKLDGLSGRRFPIETDATVRVGRFLRNRHRFYPRAAYEMIDRIAAVPSETIAGFLGAMPDDWMDTEHREKICELWSDRHFGGRLLALRTGLTDESLL